MPRKKGVSLSVGRGEKSKKGGLTAKGRKKYNAATGSNLQAPVTEKNPTGKRAARSAGRPVTATRAQPLSGSGSGSGGG